MTTTQLFSGLDGDRNSSRVLAPPGGKSNNIFGGGDDTPPQPSKAKGQAVNPITGTGDSPATGARAAATPPAAAQAQTNNATPTQKTPAARGGQFNPITGEAYSYNNNQTDDVKEKAKGNFNPITGEAVGQQKSAEAEKPTTRIRNPPGGKSSGLW